MGYFGLDHPNPRAKANPDGRYWGYATRKGGQVSGVVVVHSAEVAPDYVGEDRGAEATAAYFTHSARAASYHRIVDSDSIVAFLPLSHTAFHDATGTNHHSIGVSMGTQAHTWGTDETHDDRMLRNAAKAVAEALQYAAGQRANPMDFARWITPAQARAKQPGLVEHGQMDPARRSDPWTTHRLRPELRDRLLRYVREELGDTTPDPEDDMTPAQEAKLDALTRDIGDFGKALLALSKQVDDLAVGGYKGHQPLLPGVDALKAQLLPEHPEGSRSVRKLLELIYNVLYDADGKPRAPIGRVLGLD